MMPLTNTLQQTTLFSSNDFTMPEHFGDDRWTILHGDVMHIVPHMTRAVFDAVITDPPYASGGASQTQSSGTHACNLEEITTRNACSSTGGSCPP